MRAAFGLPRIGEWLSQQRMVTRLAWQVSRLDAATVLDTLDGRITDVTIWSIDGRADRVPERVPVAAFGGINPNHWWLIATVR